MTTLLRRFDDYCCCDSVSVAVAAESMDCELERIFHCYYKYCSNTVAAAVVVVAFSVGVAESMGCGDAGY